LARDNGRDDYATAREKEGQMPTFRKETHKKRKKKGSWKEGPRRVGFVALGGGSGGGGGKGFKADPSRENPYSMTMNAASIDEQQCRKRFTSRNDSEYTREITTNSDKKKGNRE